jgi:hypothetical protein
VEVIRGYYEVIAGGGGGGIGRWRLYEVIMRL